MQTEAQEQEEAVVTCHPLWYQEVHKVREETKYCGCLRSSSTKRNQQLPLHSTPICHLDES